METNALNGPSSTGGLVWFITGTSSGFVRRLVHSALARGDKVVTTARTIEHIRDFPKTDNLHLLQLDVTAGTESTKSEVDEAITYFGRIDVVVNNAGIGVRATVEEGGSKLFLEQIQTNVVGLLDVTTAVLPHMRARRSGTVVFIGSRSSWKSETPVVGFYSASKASVRVLGEALAAEVAQFSIRVLIAEPGSFRTENILSLPTSTYNNYPDYNPMREKAKQTVKLIDGNQPNDPVKAMELLVDVVRGEGKAKGRKRPLYLPLRGNRGSYQGEVWGYVECG